MTQSITEPPFNKKISRFDVKNKKLCRLIFSSKDDFSYIKYMHLKFISLFSVRRIQKIKTLFYAI